MNDETGRVERLSADDLVTGFSRSPIVLACVAAVVLHLVVVGLDYGISYTRAAMRAGAEDGDAAAAARPADMPPATAAAPQPNTAKTGDAEEAPAGFEDTPVGKRITEAADPNQTPELPDLDLSIDETNP